MRWLADECVDAALVRRLRGAGHDVIYAAEVAPGATEAQILRRANDEDRLLLTEDKDFREFVFRSSFPVAAAAGLDTGALGSFCYRAGSWPAGRRTSSSN